MPQHRILETLSSSEGIQRLAALTASQSFPHRTALAKVVCREFRFLDARGGPQLSTCLVALRTLQARGSIQLPPPVHSGRSNLPRRLGHPVPAPRSVPPQAGQVEQLELQLVRSPHQGRVWNELMQREHPRGAVRHVGAQLRYLIDSAHGCLGAIGFAAAALAVAPRDRFIGWDTDRRLSHLHRVLNLSRFLIRPSVQCRNLASMTLALCLRRLADDFRPRYGYAPYLLETFVDTSRHAGACFQAANWTFVGRTAGRGRHAPTGTRVPVKAVFVYPVRRDWRRRLGVPPRTAPPAPAHGLDSPRWAQQEFGHAPLGDVRWSRRLVQCAALMATAPGASFVSVAQSDRALMKAYYRMIDQPADARMTPANILAPHRSQTLQRMRRESTVLCIQDGTDLNFAAHGGCRGLGLIGKNKGSQGTLGLHMHSTLAVSTAGVPLGLPLIQYEAPDGRREKDKPHERRKTQRWARGLRDCADMAAELGGTRLVAVMDREADVFELFAACRPLRGVDLLVRARHNRKLGKGMPKLFDGLRAAPAQAWRTINVPRRSARRGTRQQKTSQLRPARVAKVALRWRTLNLPAPAQGPARGLPPLPLQVVHVREEPVPAGAERLEWFLLTSVGVRSASEAERMLDWYRLRWRIEDWHRVLKSGCKVEYLGHRTGERIERAVTIKAVIAWRLTVMTLLGRDTPELAAETMFSAMELVALHDFAADHQLPKPTNLGLAVRTTAQLGGYLNRKGDAPPGHQILWEGYTRLATIAQAFERAKRLGPTSKWYRTSLK